MKKFLAPLLLSVWSASGLTPTAHAGPKLNFPAKYIVFDIGDVLVALRLDEWKARMLPIAGALDDPDFRAVVEAFETGKSDRAEFIRGLRGLRPENKDLRDQDIITAWNSQLGDADCGALRKVRELKEGGFKTYALSTTNPLHIPLIEERMRGCFPGEKSDPLALLFDKRFYTPDLGMLKPDPAIYRKIVAAGAMDPARTLFLDDSPSNVIGAQQAGIFALLVPIMGQGPRYFDWLPKILPEPGATISSPVLRPRLRDD